MSSIPAMLPNNFPHVPTNMPPLGSYPAVGNRVTPHVDTFCPKIHPPRELSSAAAKGVLDDVNSGQCSRDSTRQGSSYSTSNSQTHSREFSQDNNRKRQTANHRRNSKRKLQKKPSSKQDEGFEFVRLHPKAENLKVTFEPQVTSTPRPSDQQDVDESISDCPETPEWKLPQSESDSGLDSEDDSEESTVDFPFRISKGKELYPQSRVPFIDTHCHLDYMFVKAHHYTSFKSYIHKKDFPYNFSGCITCFCDPPSITDESYYTDVLAEAGVWGTFGLHPHNAALYNENLLQAIRHANTHPKSLAWGEIGLDYTAKTTDEEKHVQQRAFVGQLRAAVEMGKPVVIHGRCSHEDTFSLLKQYCPADHRIHYHCFSASLQFAERLNEFFPNLFIGIAGIITYRNDELQNVVREFPFDRILVETDAPYMRPFYRKFLDRESPKVSTPGMGVVIAQKIAHIRGMELDDVLIQMRENVSEMYDI